jgi:hypothetical protein
MRLLLNVALVFFLGIACFQKAESVVLQMSDQRKPEDAYLRHKNAAIRINDLAGRIHSEADAKNYVFEIAVLFAKEIPPAYRRQDFLDKIAHAEYGSTSNPARLIPEQRVADVWNHYVREIGAPEETIVNAAEIHNMRDGTFTGAQIMWERGTQTVWTMPNIFAIGPDGKVTEGCRAVEVVRIIHELDDLFQNLRNARDRLREGIVPSDAFKTRVEKANSRQQGAAQLVYRSDTNPIRPAEMRYVQKHGLHAYQELLNNLFDELFPSE